MPIDSLEVVRAEGNYARLVTGERTYLLRETMASLAKRLSRYRFVRLGRSAIVRLDAVRELEPTSSGQLRVRLSPGVQVEVSRRHRRELEKRLGL